MSVRSGVVDVEEIRIGGIGLRFLVDGTVTEAGVTMFEMTVAPGAEYFREIRELQAGGGPLDPKAMAEVMLRYGLVPVKPA